MMVHFDSFEESFKITTTAANSLVKTTVATEASKLVEKVAITGKASYLKIVEEYMDFVKLKEVGTQEDERYAYEMGLEGSNLLAEECSLLELGSLFSKNQREHSEKWCYHY